MSVPIEHLLRRAQRLHRQGRLAEAIDAWVEVLRLRPALADGWYELGYLLKSVHRFDDALAAYAQALRHRVRAPEEAHLNRAVIYADHLRRDDEAERELEAALQLAPGFLPALLNLGNLHEERGRREPAIACYRRIVDRAGAADPRARALQAEARVRLAQLDAPTSLDAPQLDALRALVAERDLPTDVRANAGFALGRALDRLDAPAEAFAAFAAANACVRGSGPHWDRGRCEQFFDALIAQPVATAAASDGTEAARVATGRGDGDGPWPIFICGPYRSGSTLLEQVLAAHPAFTAGGELGLLPRLVATGLQPFPAALGRLGDAEAAALAARYREGLVQRFPAADGFVTDKRPDNFLLIGVIRRLFPRALIVHTRRDLRDVGLSIFMQHLDPRVAGYASDLGDIGHWLAQYRRLMAHWRRQCGDALVEIDYEALVQAPQDTLTPLLARLGLDWDPSMLSFHRRDATVKTASYWQVRRPLNADGCGRWRRYEAMLAPLRDALA